METFKTAPAVLVTPLLRSLTGNEVPAVDQSAMLPIPEFEQWLDIPGFDGYYQVSDQGRVRSLDRTLPFKGGVRRWRGRLMNISLSRGYPAVALARDGESSTHAVHVLVMATFVGPRPEGMVVCHGPGGVLDASLSNLYYGTQKRNCGPDKLRDGTLSWGEAHGGSVLTEEIVKNLRRRYRDGEQVTVMMDELGVSRTAIDCAISGKTWRHLPGSVPLRGGKGEAVPWSKLTESDVREIRRRVALGEQQKLLAEEFNVGRACINVIVKRKSWKHVA